MAGVPGWYPDPGGADDRYRYWDGSTWSSGTTSDPRQPAPVAGQTTITAARRSGRAGMVVLALILVVVIVVVALVVRRPTTIIDYGPGPTGTESAFDDRSPDPTPTPSPSPTPSASPSPSPTPDPDPDDPDPDDPEGLVACPAGGPNERAAHPVDGRVHGGNLSFTEVSRFGPAAPEARLSFARDVTQQTLRTNESPGWIAQLAVGQLRASDGFTGNARATAEGVTECAVTSALWGRWGPVAKQLESEAVTVSGRRGWKVTVDVTVTNPGLPFAGDRAVFVVVPDGDDWGLFFGAVPIGDTELTGVMDRVVTDLRVD